jgi:hypothetical protein
LQFLKGKSHDNGPQSMQELFPEGKFFSYALYAQSWIGYLSKYEERGDSVWQEGIAEIKWSIEQLESYEVAKNFDLFNNFIPKQDKFSSYVYTNTCIDHHRGLDIEYGIFYQGWLNYTLLKYWKLNPTKEIESKWDRTSNLIMYAYRCNNFDLLEAYPGSTWPVDNIVAVASLSLEGTYTNTIDSVMKNIKKHIDPNTGLIDHYLGDSKQQARATSNVMNLIFLKSIDTQFANDQYELFSNEFKDNVLGINAIREYPRGFKGRGDVDSGPLIWSYSPVASGVFLGAAKANNDTENFRKSLRNIELFGLPIRVFNKRMYWGGSFYMTDLFAVWCKVI